MNYSRRERRELAKRLGLTNPNESLAKRNERVTRSIEAGKQIHQQFQMQVANSLRNQASEIEAKALASLTESHGEAEAVRILANNRAVEQKRKEKLAKKRTQR